MSLLFKCRPNEMCLSTEKKRSNQIQMSIQSIQFHPPKPQYTITPLNNNTDLNATNTATATAPQQVQFNHSTITNLNLPKWITSTCYRLPKGKKDHIIALHIQNSITIPKGDDALTLIYSHDESSDLGTLYPFLIDLSIQLKVNVIAYDYTGYGQSSGKAPSKDSLMKDIDQVLSFALNDLTLNKDQLLFYGVDIGIVPSVIICCKVSYKQVYGLILVSLLLINELVNGMFKCISCPVYIINGRKNPNCDAIKAVSEQFKNKQSWYPDSLGQDQITLTKRAKFYFKLRTFIKQVSLTLSSSNVNESLCSEFRISTHLTYDFEDEGDSFSYNYNYNYKNEDRKKSNGFSTSTRQTGITDIGQYSNGNGNGNGNYNGVNGRDLIVEDEDSDLSYEGSL